MLLVESNTDEMHVDERTAPYPHEKSELTERYEVEGSGADGIVARR